LAISGQMFQIFALLYIKDCTIVSLTTFMFDYRTAFCSANNITLSVYFIDIEKKYDQVLASKWMEHFKLTVETL